MCRGQETTLAVILTSILRQDLLVFSQWGHQASCALLFWEGSLLFLSFIFFRSTEIIEVGITRLVFFVLWIYFIFIYLCVCLCV